MGSDPASVMPDSQSGPCCSSSPSTATRNSPHSHDCHHCHSHSHIHCHCHALPQGADFFLVGIFISPKNESHIQGGGGVRETAYGVDDENGKLHFEILILFFLTIQYSIVHSDLV